MEEILNNLRKAVLEYHNIDAAHWASEAVEANIDPLKTMEVLTSTIRQIGDGFGKGELWLPDLVGGAAAMQSAMPIIEEAMKKEHKARESLGIVVIGTVFGDLHNIGKNMVATLLIAGGFEVIDVGINIKSDEFVSAVKKHNPRILAMSALLTMTAPEQGKVISALVAEGIRDKVKVMIGGGAITKEFSDEIGADGYAATAPRAVDLAKSLI